MTNFEYPIDVLKVNTDQQMISLNLEQNMSEDQLTIIIDFFFRQFLRNKED